MPKGSPAHANWQQRKGRSKKKDCNLSHGRGTSTPGVESSKLTVRTQHFQSVWEMTYGSIRCNSRITSAQPRKIKARADNEFSLSDPGPGETDPTAAGSVFRPSAAGDPPPAKASAGRFRPVAVFLPSSALPEQWEPDRLPPAVPLAPAVRRLAAACARVCGLGLGFVVALQPEVNRCHFERHLVARIQRSIQLGIQLMHVVIPWIGLQPASQRKRRDSAPGRPS